MSVLLQWSELSALSKMKIIADALPFPRNAQAELETVISRILSRVQAVNCDLQFFANISAVTL